VLRVLNPGAEPREARVRLELPFASAEAVRLDEEPAPGALEREGARLRFPVPPHSLRTLRIRI